MRWCSLLSHCQGGGCSHVPQGYKVTTEVKQQWCIRKHEWSGVLEYYKAVLLCYKYDTVA
jgi:hypothetical protein